MTPYTPASQDEDNPDVSSHVDSFRDDLSTLTRVVQDLSDKVSDLAERVDDMHELIARHHGANGYDSDMDYLSEDSDE